MILADGRRIISGTNTHRQKILSIWTCSIYSSKLSLVWMKCLLHQLCVCSTSTYNKGWVHVFNPGSSLKTHVKVKEEPTPYYCTQTSGWLCWQTDLVFLFLEMTFLELWVCIHVKAYPFKLIGMPNYTYMEVISSFLFIFAITHFLCEQQSMQCITKSFDVICLYWGSIKKKNSLLVTKVDHGEL